MEPGGTGWSSDQEAIALVQFQGTGYVNWYHSIPPTLSVERVSNYVKVFLASVSISCAFTDSYHGELGGKKPIVKSRGTSVLTNDGITIVANPCYPNSSSWYAILAPKYPFQPNPSLDLCILPALQQAAIHLTMPSPTPSVNHDDLQCLFKSICRNAIFDQGWNAQERAAKLVRDGLIDLVDKMSAVASQCPAFSAPSVYKAPYFHHLAATFCTAVAQAYSSSTRCTFCVISPDIRIVYANRSEPSLAASFLWYYSRVMNLGARKRRREVRDISDCGVVRFWYWHRDWVLLAQTTYEELSPLDNHAIRDAAHALVVFASDRIRASARNHLASRLTADDDSTSARK